MGYCSTFKQLVLGKADVRGAPPTAEAGPGCRTPRQRQVCGALPGVPAPAAAGGGNATLWLQRIRSLSAAAT